jgi:LysM repeat protein
MNQDRNEMARKMQQEANEQFFSLPSNAPGSVRDKPGWPGLREIFAGNTPRIKIPFGSGQPLSKSQKWLKLVDSLSRAPLPSGVVREQALDEYLKIEANTPQGEIITKIFFFRFEGGKPKFSGIGDPSQSYIYSEKTIAIEIDILGIKPETHLASQNEHSTNQVNAEQFSQIVVQEGDTLWSIAETAIGSGEFWPQIWEANRNNLMSEDPNLIFPGEVIKIPNTITLNGN